MPFKTRSYKQKRTNVFFCLFVFFPVFNNSVCLFHRNWSWKIVSGQCTLQMYLTFFSTKSPRWNVTIRMWLVTIKWFKLKVLYWNLSQHCSKLKSLVLDLLWRLKYRLRRLVYVGLIYIVNDTKKGKHIFSVFYCQYHQYHQNPLLDHLNVFRFCNHKTVEINESLFSVKGLVM